MKKQSGITLLALVITIVVMLILAAVTINTIVSDDGLVRKSQEAKFKMEATTYKERTQPTKVPQGQETTDYNHIWALKEKLNAQMKTLEKGYSNADDAYQMLRTAEGSVSSTVSLLKDLKEDIINYWVKLRNQQNITDEERNTLKEKIEKTKYEINNNADVEFNSMKLLDGTAKINVQLGGTAIEQGELNITIGNMNWETLWGTDEIDKMDLENLELVDSLIDRITEAIGKALDQQTTLGSQQMRLDYVMESIARLDETIGYLESRIYDANMADAMERYQNNDLNAVDELNSRYANEENAIKNANSWDTTINLINIAKTSLEQIDEILCTLKAKAKNAANETNTDDDRQTIQVEVEDSILEVERQLAYCIVANRKLLQGDLQYVEKIDTDKLGISNLSVLTRKDAKKTEKLLKDAAEYIEKVITALENKEAELRKVESEKADPGYAFDIVYTDRKTEQTEKMDIDGVINSKFTIENGILYYTGTNEFEKKWAQELNIQIKQ